MIDKFFRFCIYNKILWTINCHTADIPFHMTTFIMCETNMEWWILEINLLSLSRS